MNEPVNEQWGKGHLSISIVTMQASHSLACIDSLFSGKSHKPKLAEISYSSNGILVVKRKTYLELLNCEWSKNNKTVVNKTAR